MPHAMRWLCPTMMPGVPGSATPAAFMPGASRCVMYQMPGSEYSRCMSLDSSALPDAVWHVARQQRLARRRVAARDGPGVGPRAGIAQSAHRVQEIHLGAVALRHQVV